MPEATKTKDKYPRGKQQCFPFLLALSMRRLFLLLISSCFIISCGQESSTSEQSEEIENLTLEDNSNDEEEIEAVAQTSIVVLGTCQDAGFPQINCNKECCRGLHEQPEFHKEVVSLGVIDPDKNEKYIFEATPDFSEQLSYLSEFCDFGTNDVPTGIFLTHAHIGHYTGLMYLGKEAMNAEMVPVYAMPKMYDFLKKNGPWSQLVTNKNIELFKIFDQQKVLMSDNISVVPLIVPHRDEFSETVGYKIYGPSKVALFIPDIDKWEKWSFDIKQMITEVDYAFLDATFYDENELPNRDKSEVPHPFVEESMELFSDLSDEEKNKIIFIHFNHTNPLLNSDSKAYSTVEEKGFRIAKKGDVFVL